MPAEVIGHRFVVGDRRVGPTCHSDPHLGGRPRREQTGNAVRVGARQLRALVTELENPTLRMIDNNPRWGANGGSRARKVSSDLVASWNATAFWASSDTSPSLP